MAIIIIRHGQSNLIMKYKQLKENGIPSKPENIEQFRAIAEVYESDSDSNLSEKGKEQIKETASKLLKLGYPISRVFVSPTRRTVESYDIISEAFTREGITFPTYTIDSRIGIIESGFLHAIRGNENDDTITKFFEQKQQNGLTGKEFAHAYITGETILQAAQRIYNFLDDTRGIWNNKNMLVVTHKSAMRVFRSYFEHDLSNQGFFECEPNNGQVMIYGDIFTDELTPSEVFNIRFRNFISSIPKGKIKTPEFLNYLAAKGLKQLNMHDLNGQRNPEGEQLEH